MELSRAALRATTVAVVVLAAGISGTGHADAASRKAAGSSDDAVHISAAESWIWPLEWPLRVTSPFVAPPHEYGRGHRGIDLAPLAGMDVVAPASGIVAFSGRVAGRGILTIDHGGGLVTTLEPIEPALLIGEVVGRGDVAGTLAVGGHATPGTLHFGVRLDGAYINPMLLLGGVPRAVLLPCC